MGCRRSTQYDGLYPVRKKAKVGHKIIAFKAFKTTEEFEEWQEDHEIQIISATPIVNDMSADITEHSANADMRFGIFVQYVK